MEARVILVYQSDHLRAVLLAKMSERLHRLKTTKQKETKTKAEKVAVKFIKVISENLHFQTKKYSTVLEAMRTCKQITKSASTPSS